MRVIKHYAIKTNL